ncbi:hypothetical protein RJ639_042086 [Escallonia herrerae]|uniref:Uncharacterized protein n=1 Tax=Escallonia herrerae TaxID=1293975 RepID=A0AA89B7I2_9ASTE|nr:hypothetical protein RJ639_042086 [Escallonia herrerae]
MATMESLIGLVNRIQRACTVLGDHGGKGMSLWEALPSVAVVGGQSSGKLSVLESVVGRDFLPRGSGIVTRRPLVLQLHKTEGQSDYAEFLHAPKKRFTDFAAVRKEIQDETDRITGRTKQISNIPIHLSIYSPNVVNLTVIDLPGLTKVAVEGQIETIVEDIENMVRSYVEKACLPKAAQGRSSWACEVPNCIILAISPANQDIATSDAIKHAREVDPTGERTFGVVTKLDLMDKGTNALDVLEGRAYRLQHPWVGIVNRSQADINKNVDMLSARRKEQEYSGPEQRIPSIIALINKTMEELNAELDRIGRPIGVDGGPQLYTILELCRAFDRIFKEHLDGGRPGGDRIYGVFDNQLPAALKKLPLDRHLSLNNVRKVVAEADGYQPHLIAPEQGYRRLIDGSLGFFKGPAEASVDAVNFLAIQFPFEVFQRLPNVVDVLKVHFVLKELVRKSLAETQELKRFPSLQADIAAAANDALERFRDESRKTILRLVEMESTYLTVDFFRKLQLEPEKHSSPSGPNLDRYSEAHLRRIGIQLFTHLCDSVVVPSYRSNVSSYIGMVCDTLKNSIPKAVVHCQVREAKRSLLNHFYAQIGRRELSSKNNLKLKSVALERYLIANLERKFECMTQKEQLGKMLDEDPSLMDKRETIAKRLELYKSARDEIDSVAWK